MRTCIIYVAALLCASVSYGQMTAAEKVKEIYGEQTCIEMETSNPGMLDVLEKYADHGIEVKPSTHGKYSNAELLTSIKLRGKVENSVSITEFLEDYDGGDFNPLKYEFFPSMKTEVYRLEGTTRLLVIKGQSSL